MPSGPCQRKHADAQMRVGSHHGTGAGRERGSRGEHVIDEQDMAAGHSGSGAEEIFDVPDALSRALVGLRFIISDTSDPSAQHGQSRDFGNSSGQQQTLIVTPLPLPAPM